MVLVTFFFLGSADAEKLLVNFKLYICCICVLFQSIIYILLLLGPGLWESLTLANAPSKAVRDDKFPLSQTFLRMSGLRNIIKKVRTGTRL